MTGKPVLLNAIHTNSALFPMHQEVKWQAAHLVGVPNLCLHKYRLYHSRCTSRIRNQLTRNRHVKDSHQGLQVNFGMEFSRLKWQGKTSTANSYHAWAKMQWVRHRRTVKWTPARFMQASIVSYHVVHLFIDLANAVAERDRYPFQRECIT